MPQSIIQSNLSNRYSNSNIGNSFFLSETSNGDDNFNYLKMFETSNDTNHFNLKHKTSIYPPVINDIISDKRCENLYHDTYSTNPTLNQFNQVNDKEFNSWGYSVIKTPNNKTQQTGYMHKIPSKKDIDIPNPLHYKDIFKSIK